MPLTDSPDVWTMMLKSAAMLCIVLGALLLTLYLIKRFTLVKGTLAGTPLIRVLATHYITPKERLILIQVLDQKILIGSTPQQMNCLAVVDPEGKIDVQGAPVGNPFQRFVEKAVRKGKTP